MGCWFTSLDGGGMGEPLAAASTPPLNTRERGDDVTRTTEDGPRFNELIQTLIASRGSTDGVAGNHRRI
jgi:hypothetical protein